MYVANTRSSQYIHAIGSTRPEYGRAQHLRRPQRGQRAGHHRRPQGRQHQAGLLHWPGGIWVIAPEDRRIGVIRRPEQAVNFAFGGPDLRTLFCCAHSSVYTLRVKVSGIRIPGTSDAGSNLTTRPVAVSQADRPRCRAPASPRARTSSSETGVLSANRHGSDEVFGKYFCSAITVVLHWRVPPIAHDW